MKRWFFCLLFALCMPAMAMINIAIYELSVPVSIEEAGFPYKSMQMALKQVLIRATGQADRASEISANISADALQELVQQYSYQQIETEGVEQLQLNVQFNSKLIRELLAKTNLSVWHSSRPVLLVWLVVGSGSEQHMASSAEGGALVDQLESWGRLYGVPIVFPSMDLQDVSAVQVRDIVSDNISAIKLASKRYQADAILMGQVSSSGDHGSHSFWRFYLQDVYKVWQFDQNNLDGQLQQLQSQLILVLRNYYAVNAGQRSQVTIRVEHVDGLDVYTSLARYLNQLDSVDRVELDNIQGSKVVLRLVLSGTMQSLMDDVAADHQLVLLSAQDDQVDLVFGIEGGTRE